MNNREYIAELAQQSGYTQTDTQKMVAAVIEQMGNSFEEGNSVLIPNFGTFEVKKRLERIIVNPGTQQRMLVPPKLVLNFRPKESVKDKLNKA
ncbi:HU family DNA-binding protein [Hallella faecis]|uniref:HU family DNA-binding protein n=1 Tax=Hallella faecis TaxID=2841596 RepID=A0ABV1FMU5_9BACT|nr:HU family DNA-binding protein [Hallella faecis]MBU0288843.1 HU family DNA-binding protein [Hallella faecis]